MKKATIAGLIVLAAVAIGITSVSLYNNNVISNTDQTLDETGVVNTTAKHFTVELSESVGINENP